MKTSRFLVALGVIVCLVLSPVIALMPANTAQAQPADSAWPMFGQNLQRTGRSPYSGPEVPKLKWSFTTGYDVYSSPAIGADGTIYVGSLDNRLYAINPDGSQKWSFTAGDVVNSSPAIGADGTIYVGSLDNRLYAINPDGSQKWSFTAGDVVNSSPAIGADGTVYVGSADYNLYAINPDGSQKWSFTTGGSVLSSPAIGANGTIYVGATNGTLYAINPDGSLKWSFTTGGRIYSSPAIGADGAIYVGADDWNLYAINPDGSQKWSFATGGWVESSPAVGSGGTIYVGSYDDKLYAINPDGSQKWSFTTGDWVESSPAIGADGTIYVGSEDDKLYAVNPDGSQKWSFTTGGWVYSSPSIGADGTIYVGSYDNKLYAITRKYDLTISSSAGGSVTTPGEGTFPYGQGTVVSLVAEPDEGCRFVSWTGDTATIADVDIASTNITMNDDYSITATFEQIPPQFDLTMSSTNGGSVTAPGEGTFAYDQGTVVNLVAEAEESYRFTNWSGDVYTIADVEAPSTTITMNANYTVMANFEPITVEQFDLTISRTGGGSVTAPGEGSFTYDRGARVNLVAEAEYGYRFVNWSGDVDTVVDVLAASTIVIMEADYEITAKFENARGCFIATAAYGTAIAEKIQILREFRDGYLLTNPVGKALVEFYYRISPPTAEFIAEHPGLKPIVRAGLLPAVAISTVAVNTSPAEKMAIVGLLAFASVAVAVWLTRRRGRSWKYLQQ
jgi:outer membrane protein assembly factor BamB